MINRKDLYVDNSLILEQDGDSLFGDIYIEHNSLPEINFDDIDTSVEFLGQKISFPLIINSMTGGTEKGFEINEILYKITSELDLVLAVGSQEESNIDEDPNLFINDLDDEIRNQGMVLSNLSARADIKDIERAMNQINADGITIYLNSSQEAISFDGNRDLRGILENIKIMADKFSDKLIIKEKGLGMSKKTIKALIDSGIKIVDISGRGGTNMIEMENHRNYRNDFSELYVWGIPTAKSIIDARNTSKELKIIASGGIKTGLDIAKSLIIGADYVGVSGEVLKYLLHGGYEQARKYVEDLIFKTKTVMFLLGVKNIEELKQVEYRITGKLKEIL